jgi:hypothetical protein
MPCRLCQGRDGKVAIRRAKIALVPDSADMSKIQPSDLDLEAIPAVPQDGDFRSERIGVSPERYIRLYIYDSGAWQLLAEINI